ncbi:ATP-binding protein [Pedobacter cryoconitis]|uniref:histidine kinase n=1 Tax=Pedobacter cryoconitis TaxID=188932 RepID=A0A7X0MJV9_9SPHI|nr:ATP-binding protein [Pedobacter cryoconitis]MBB6501544.1 signal transduction histidine kinase/AraC-like DNA-binding protein [Pedobacter cryoconitis]
MKAIKKGTTFFVYFYLLLVSIFACGCFSENPSDSVHHDSLNFLVVILAVAIIFALIACYLLFQNQQKHKQLEIKNREILKQQEELIALSAAAQSAAEAKFNFFTHISNAFRVPLTLILLPVDEILEFKDLSAVHKHQMELIHKNVQRLLLMINQLTDFRKIEHDQMKIECTNQDFVAFSKDIISSFSLLASRKNIELKLFSSDKKIMSWFDKNMFDKVMFNLLSNAIKFSPENERVQIRLHHNKADEMLEIAIIDQGKGMTQEEIEHIFELFYQAEHGDFFGSGLGLSLSKEITELHQGTINIESKKGHGSTFCIKLPIGNIPDLYEEQPSVNDFTIDTEQLNLYAADIPSPAPVHNDHDNYLNEESILIIDENEELLKYLKNSFQEEYEVFTASNNTQGLKLAYEMVPDLIIADINLSEKLAGQLTPALKNDDRTSHIPIIIISAINNKDHQINEIKQMADLYMTKPFSAAVLKESVKNLLWNRKLLKSKFRNDNPGESKMTVISKSDKKFLHDFTDIIEQNIANDKFNVEEIANALGISRIQLYRKTKVLLDSTINDYILNKRLKKAKYLLINEDLSISEITYRVGFSSPTYFSTVFKSKYNCTPSSYKKQITINT